MNLWVRETFAHYQTVNHVLRSGGRAFDEVSDGLAGYRADGHDTIEDFRKHVQMMSGCDLQDVLINGDQWTPSIFMPRWASRITLEITDVRVEPLQEISQADAIAEGAPPSHPSIDVISREYGYEDFSRSWYAQLWEQINGPGSWAANSWVWVVCFRRSL